MSAKFMTVEDILQDTAYEFDLDRVETNDEGEMLVIGDWIVEGERQHAEYEPSNLYVDAGGEYPCADCEGGIMVFDTEAEKRVWMNQK